MDHLCLTWVIWGKKSWILLFFSFRTNWGHIFSPKWTVQTRKHKRFVILTVVERLHKAFIIIFYLVSFFHHPILSHCLSSDGLSMLWSPALPGGPVGQRGGYWQSWGLDQSDSLPTGLSQWSTGSDIPGFRNRYTFLSVVVEFLCLARFRFVIFGRKHEWSTAIRHLFTWQINTMMLVNEMGISPTTFKKVGWL